MKRLILCIMAIVMILAVPMTGFAASIDDSVEPLSVITANSKIIKTGSSSVKITASSGYDSTIELVATAQLQRKVNGSWQNYGSGVTNSTTGTSVTASKNVTVVSGYEYRVKGSHRIGVQTKTTYSTTMSF